MLAGLAPPAFWEHFHPDAHRPALAGRGAGDRARHARGRAAGGTSSGRTPGATSSSACRRLPVASRRPRSSSRATSDMVCERDPASPNDPAEGRIVLRPRRRLAHGRRHDSRRRRRRRDRGDDGARRRRVDPHGPLELLMTVAEEVGLEGANALDGSLLDRLDPDQPRQRGGRRPHRRLRGQHRHVDPGRRATRCVLPGRGHAVARGRGGLGGHSGVQIALGHANAIKVLGRVLREAYAAAPFRLVSLDGGKSRNAIPRDAVAVCSVPRDRKAPSGRRSSRRPRSSGTPTSMTDPGATVTVESAGDAADAWTEEATARLLDVSRSCRRGRSR